MKPLIKIGGRYLNVAHIVKIETSNTWIDIVTTDTTPEGVDDGWVATNERIAYQTGTPEANAIIAWADRQAEVLAKE